MYAGMSMATGLALTTCPAVGAGEGAGAGGGAGGGGSGSSVTFTSMGTAPRALSSRSSGTKPSLSNRNLYAPAGRDSKAMRPPSVRALRETGPVRVTPTLGIGAPVESCTETAKVTEPVVGAGAAPRRWAAAELANRTVIKRTAGATFSMNLSGTAQTTIRAMNPHWRETRRVYFYGCLSPKEIPADAI